jgi:membrane-associated phospholipid phosphatase
MLQSKLPLQWAWYSMVASALLLAQPLELSAQSALDLPADNRPSVIQWWHGVIVLGGLSGLMLLDNSTQRLTQRHRSSAGDDLASGVRHIGQPEGYGTITLGLLGAGLISGNHEITRAGGRLVATLFVAGATSNLAKLTFGRPRPDQSLDADVYVPFSGREAMPSGHTTMAFALATALSDDIHRTWASVGLYTVATGVAWSRLNDNRHWLSDVAAGAVVGVTSAKLVNGHWRIFNLRPPQFLLGPGSATVAWELSF